MVSALLVEFINGGSREWLADHRLFFWGAFAAIAFVTNPDPTNMAPIILTSVMVILFEATLLVSKWITRGPNNVVDQGIGDRTSTAPSMDDPALERLRQRYAAGDLTDEQFERKLEQLLETETREDIEDCIKAREVLDEHDR